jgi:hypothetical protein
MGYVPFQVGTGDGVIRKRVEHGAVWVTARVNGHLYDVAAPEPEAWALPVWGGVQHGTAPLVDPRQLASAVDLVTSWARGHAAELDVLFRQAGRQRHPTLLQLGSIRAPWRNP